MERKHRGPGQGEVAGRAARKWAVLLLGAVVLATGCATVTPPPGHGALLSGGPRVASGPVLANEVREPPSLYRRRGERVRGTVVAMVSPAEMAVRAVASGAEQVDAFEYLLALAGLDDFNDLPPRGASLTPQEALRLLTVLLHKPVTLGSFPPRMAVGHLLREVLEGGEVTREELLRRVERFRSVAVLRPDGYLAWTLNGRTQQKVGPVEWKEEAFRAGPFELGRFYTVKGWVFRQADAQLRPTMDGPGLAEVYDDADYLGRSLDGAEEAFVDLYHAMGQLLSHPWDSLVALQHLPAGVAALLASSPEYLERLRYMTRGEQVKALSKLMTNLVVTFGTAGGTTSTLTRALGGLEATVPVLSLSAEGLLVVERVVVPVGKVGTVLSGGPGAAIILQRASTGANTARTSARDYPQDYVSARTQNHSARFSSEGEARSLARQKIGKEPVEIEPGKFRSRDGKWQYRAKPEDLQGHRPGDTPHVHIERLDPKTGEVLENWHLRW